ncbi:hemerythrin domain-containing protein [uncultured Ferrovibrio sp.]|jgi:hemerythrin-like domain-containing protein|uniref:hemerythrin domain-containing protein n=1 Tax=uncultured Ferrovibrio sp. TaxID=1576913 RepID=UPI00260CA93F|nr:hemerythrin domain-containing protein [uncultured Ferrovibrio sp.]
MHRAIAVIRAEHRAFGAMLHAFVGILEDLTAGGAQPDFELLYAMLEYVGQFPDRYHHPKEDDYLFRLLHMRAPDAEGLLDALETEHIHNASLTAALRRSLDRFYNQPDDSSRLAIFRDLARRYADFHWKHMRLEEEQILPLAEARLTKEDWAEIDTAFDSNHDPMIGVDAKVYFDDLRKRIVTRTPAPLGVGERPFP